MLAGGAGSRWRARMLRTTSAEWTPWASASAQAVSTAARPSVSTAARISTICRLPSSAGVVNRLAAVEGALMFGDDPAVLADYDAVGIGVDLDRPPNRAGCHRV